MKATAAWPLAESVKKILAPYCDQIEIAGSLRRGRDWVNDIDLVVLPKEGQLEPLRARCKQRAKVVLDGQQNLIVELDNRAGGKLQVDIFIAHPEQRDLLETKPTNFGSLLLCRTGSKDHNIYLVEHAKRLGLTWNPYHGMFASDGSLLASATEEDIFRVLQVAFIPPALRERHVNRRDAETQSDGGELPSFSASQCLGGETTKPINHQTA
jgi:DNA polymerase (family 10)